MGSHGRRESKIFGHRDGEPATFRRPLAFNTNSVKHIYIIYSSSESVSTA